MNRGAQLLGALGLTQTAIAERLGCTQGYVSRVLRGRQPGLEFRRQALREFSIGVLLWDDPPAPTKSNAGTEPPEEQCA